MSEQRLDAPAQALVEAVQHLRASDAGLRQCITYLRQDGRDVPSTIEDARGCIRDALEILDE